MKLRLEAQAELHRQLCRRSLHVFARAMMSVLHPGVRIEDGFFFQALCRDLVGLTEGEYSRLLITAPPRHGKSELGAVIYAAWRLGREPSLKIMDVSYGETLGEERTRLFRQILDSGLFQWIFPALVVDRRNSEITSTTAGGYRRSISVQGAVTGLGADLIIVDDPLKAQNAGSEAHRESTIEAFQSGLLTRLNDLRTGQVLVIAQRLHERDIAGAVLETGTFIHRNYPAFAVFDEEIQLAGGGVHLRKAGEPLCPVRMPLAALEEQRRAIGAPAFAAQYQQDPGGAASGLLKWSEVARYDEAPPRDAFDWLVISLDPATSIMEGASYSVLSVWGGKRDRWHLLQIIRGRWETPDLLGQVRVWAIHWNAGVLLIEDSGIGKAVAQTLQREWRDRNSWIHRQGCRPLALAPKVDKEARFAVCVPQLLEGSVQLPLAATWLPDLQRELSAFPASSHDDQVDSISQFLNWRAANRARLQRAPGERPRGDGPRPTGSSRRPLRVQQHDWVG